MLAVRRDEWKKLRVWRTMKSRVLLISTVATMKNTSSSPVMTLSLATL